MTIWGSKIINNTNERSIFLNYALIQDAWNVTNNVKITQIERLLWRLVHYICQFRHVLVLFSFSRLFSIAARKLGLEKVKKYCFSKILQLLSKHKMYLMYHLDQDGNRVYTLDVCRTALLEFINPFTWTLFAEKWPRGKTDCFGSPR